jgi:hypothetical protein
MNGNCKLLEFFLNPRGITLSKIARSSTKTKLDLDITETTNYWNFSKSKGHNSVKNCSIVPKTDLDLDILLINPYTKFYISMCNLCKEANNWNCSKSKGHKSVKNCSIVLKTELSIDILMINLYIKFHFNMCNQCEENERKLLVDRPTVRPTAAKQYDPPSLNGCINIKEKSGS